MHSNGSAKCVLGTCFLLIEDKLLADTLVWPFKGSWIVFLHDRNFYILWHLYSTRHINPVIWNVCFKPECRNTPKQEFEDSNFGVPAPSLVSFQLLPYVVLTDIPGLSVTAGAQLVSKQHNETKEELKMSLGVIFTSKVFDVSAASTLVEFSFTHSFVHVHTHAVCG